MCICPYVLRGKTKQNISAFLGEGPLFTVDPSEMLSDEGRGGNQNLVNSYYVFGSCDYFTQIISLKVYTIP